MGEELGAGSVTSGHLLSAEDHERFVRDGFVLLRGGVPPAQVAQAVAALEDEHGDRLGDMFGVHGEVFEACFTTRVDAAVAELFGGLPHERHEITYKGRPITPDETWANGGRHVDSHYVTMLPDTWVVSAFVFLTDVPTQCGALCVKPGSARDHRRTMRRGYLHHLMEEWGADPSLEEITARAGDVALFQFNLAHASSTNRLGTQVRMALDARYSSPERIVPFTSITGASTLARATAMEDILAAEPRGAAGASAGTSPATTQVHLRHEGRTWRLFVSPGEPGVVRTESTDDFDRWDDAGVLLRTDGKITGLHLVQRWAGAVLQVTEVDGTATTVSLHQTADLRTTTPVVRLEDAELEVSAAFWTSEATGGGSIGTSALFHAVDHEVRWRSAASWEALADPTASGSCATFGTVDDGLAAGDLEVGPIVSDGEQVLITDVGAPGTTTTPWFGRARTLADLGALRPLPTSTASPPRCVRLYDRANRYWLVTYLQATDGVPRFGVIDWAAASPTLVEVSDREQMATALRTIGYH